MLPSWKSAQVIKIVSEYPLQIIGYKISPRPKFKVSFLYISAVTWNPVTSINFENHLSKIYILIICSIPVEIAIYFDARVPLYSTTRNFNIFFFVH